MSEIKPDPAADQQTSSEPRLAEDETKKVTEGSTEGAESAASKAAGAAASTGAAIKDNVFSMFGGGPKKAKEPKAEDDEGADEPSGSSKKKTDDVSRSGQRNPETILRALELYAV
jgi:Ran-binding protein 1